MERVRHQLACANCMLANANHPCQQRLSFFCKNIPNFVSNLKLVTKRQHMLRHMLPYIFINHSSFE